MAGDPDSDDVVTVTQDGVTVEKSFTVDEFPVPAVKFVLRSEADEPVEIRLVDDVPESFDMEGVGFHPEYDGESWTAYRDHRVEYERTLDPGEEVTTVYGVRVDDPGAGERFLGEPRLESLTPGNDRATPEDVLGRETTQAVRDALAGEGDLAGSADAAEDELAASVDAENEVVAETGADLDEPSESGELDLADPGSGESDAGVAATGGADEEIDLGGSEADDAGATADSDATEPADDTEAVEEAEPEAYDEPVAPRTVDDGLTSAVEPSEGSVGPSPSTGGGAPETEEEASEAEEEEPEVEPAVGGEGAAPSGAVPGSVVAALAAEIREGEVDDEDLDVLRDALDAGVPRSVEVRIDRLQNRTEDLAAYTDALEAFIDEKGTGQEVLDGLEAETTALREDLDAVEAEVDEAAEERDDLAAAVGAHDERLSEVESDLAGLEDRVAALDDELDAVRSAVTDVEESVEDLAGDTDEDLGDLRDTLDDVEATVADMEDEIEDFEEFRDRMRDAFGS